MMVISGASKEQAKTEEFHLQALDDTIVSIPRSLLVAHSSFFADLPDFLQSQDNVKALIPLHTATSAGLIVLARLLPYLPLKTDHTPQPQRSRTTQIGQANFMLKLSLEDLAGIANALDLARTYDIDGFVNLFIGAGQSIEGERPLFAWAISAITEKWMNVDRRAMKTLRSKEVLPESAINTLRDLAPMRLEKLLSIRKEWTDATSALWIGLTKARVGEDYEPGCGGWRGLFGCIAKSMIPKWKDLRMMAGKKVYQMMIMTDTDNPSTLAQGIVDKVVPCSTCARRLCNSFAVPLQTFWVDTDRFKFT